MDQSVWHRNCTVSNAGCPNPRHSWGPSLRKWNGEPLLRVTHAPKCAILADNANRSIALKGTQLTLGALLATGNPPNSNFKASSASSSSKFVKAAPSATKVRTLTTPNLLPLGRDDLNCHIRDIRVPLRATFSREGQSRSGSRVNHKARRDVSVRVPNH